MIYTKSEIAQKLNMSASRPNDIRRKLDKLGYKYEYSGRGKNFLVEIIEEPKEVINNPPINENIIEIKGEFGDIIARLDEEFNVTNIFTTNIILYYFNSRTCLSQNHTTMMYTQN